MNSDDRVNPPRADWCWYHVIVTTYGAWLYGDSRGFRTRHHREHVEGDYKNPPPVGLYRRREYLSMRSMYSGRVRLASGFRRIIGEALRDRLAELGATVIAITVARQHAHLLAKMPQGIAREWTAAAKKHAWFVARDHEWRRKLWGKRSKAVPIRTRERQLAVFHYILRHAREGAWVWSIRDEQT